MIFKRLKNNYLLLALCIACYLLAYFISHQTSRKESYIIQDVERILHKKEKIAEQVLKNIQQQPDSVLRKNIAHYIGLYTEQGIMFLIYDQDSLVYWTDHTVAFESKLSLKDNESKLLKLKNGWFEVIKKKYGQRSFYSFILIKREYPIENQYLNNTFQKDFGIDKDIQLINEKSSNNVINDKNGNYLFSLLITHSKDSNGYYLILRILFIIIGSIALILFIKNCCRFLIPQKSYLFSVFFAAIVIILRLISIKYRIPEVFYDLELFNPQLYGDASSIWLSSLGDFFINILLASLVIYEIDKSIPLSSVRLYTNKLLKHAIVFTCLILLYFFSNLINTTAISLIIDSKIPYNISNLFKLNSYSYVAILSTGILLLVFYQLASKAADLFFRLSISTISMVVNFIVSGFSIALIAHLSGKLDEVLFLWSTLATLIIYLSKYRYNNRGGLITNALLLIIVCFYLSHLILKFSNFKEHDTRIILAEKFSSEQDPIAEHLFSESEALISTDTLLANELNKLEFIGEEKEKEIIQKYFTGYWKKYDISIYLKPQNTVDTVFSANIKPTHNKSFYYVNNPFGDIHYVGFIKLIAKNNSSRRELAIEFNSRSFSEGIGFPELLIDQKNSVYTQLKNYSYAKYRNNKLVEFYGSYSYPLVNKNYITANSNYYFFEKDGYTHLIYKNLNNAYVTLSTKNLNLLDQLTAFSFLFTIYSLALIVVSLLLRIVKGKNIAEVGFKNRIQYSLTTVIFILTLLFAGASILYIKKEYEKNNEKNIREKIFMASEEIRHELQMDEITTPGFVEYCLQNASYIFSSDFSLYNTNGDMVASSIPKLYKEGFLSKKMSPLAFTELLIKQKNEFTNNEKIDNLQYLSAYTSFRDKNGKLVGFLNMPYFSKQSDLEQEISGFLSAIINIYVLMFLLSVTITFFISSYVTHPLYLVQQKMRKVKLGGANEPIDWKNNDEIGSLVNEYNRMIDELAKSAELLAKSERESAWREMAKQVAHEIKNPLTPMKLSIQHFQKTWKERIKDNPDSIKQFTETLIDQIETLSSIANEFSNFANMPKANQEEISLSNIILHCINLFENSPDLVINFTSNNITDAHVYADKEQLIRVFNNLIKNAIQAIPTERKGKIDISLNQEPEAFLIEVKDNGLGINDELKDKIFTPNFTTKNSGTGLGLAMTKNIIEGFNGKIWFETKEGTGSSFFISLPAYKQ